MSDHVRIRRDWIDVRHEYLQVDGLWKAGACAKPGLCRECNRDGERQPMEFISKAWEPGVDQARAARIIIAAHLYIPVKLADDDAVLRATDFRRLSIAFDLERLTGLPIADADVLAARTLGDLLSLVSMQEAA
ncbi:hypothetical protein ASE85_02320 [Sphingobium sp. Leaf26]|uniref:hypothetical protein n=1 Tax=Sphingobium sp. Leaf26 TaxID=1735693 RepID=UPI0006F1C9B1|nr:hypothetical protein [Sphingobium sp. Leaf26]KQN09795.1 hypothetical protein ASE85_02320 [Sphingobium sp. Leaf26]